MITFFSFYINYFFFSSLIIIRRGQFHRMSMKGTSLQNQIKREKLITHSNNTKQYYRMKIHSSNNQMQVCNLRTKQFK